MTSSPKVPTLAKFVIGGVSGVAAQTVTHPSDVLKLNMQILRTPLSQTIAEIYKTKGVGGFYVGLNAAFLRQVTYTTTRLGIYTTLLEHGQERFGRLNYVTMVSIGMIAGIVGSFVGTPTDMVLIRMVIDTKLPPEKQRNYKNAIAALLEIGKTEGIRTLWRGAIPTMGRAAIVNGVQLGTYSKAKMMLIDTGYFKNGIFVQFIAANISGFIMCTTSLPVDVSKTRFVVKLLLANGAFIRIYVDRIQNWQKSGKTPGMLSMMMDIAKTEGILSLWRGFVPYYSKAGPTTIVTMLCMDQLQRLYIYLSSR